MHTTGSLTNLTADDTSGLRPAADPMARRLLRRGMRPLASTILGLGVLQFAVTTGVLSERYFPSVPNLIRVFVGLLGQSTFWQAMADTIQGALIGFGISALLAIPFGTILGSSAVLFHASRGVMEFLRAVPTIAVIPLVILLYGTGLLAKVVLVIFATFFPLLLQTIYGVRQTEPTALDTARSFRLGKARELTLVIFPSALPLVVTGLRISATIALLVALSAELIIGSPGLGQEIMRAQAGNATALMYALVLATGLLGFLLNVLLTQLELRVVPWGGASRREVR